MVLKFLGIGKKSEYFLEAEPLSSNGSEPAQKAEDSAKTEAEPAKPEPAPSPETPPSAATGTPAPAASAKATATATEQSKNPFKSSKDKKAKQTAPKAEPAATAPTPETNSKPQTPATFATNHLMPGNTPRRRPGPSLDPFKDMARQVNTRL